MPERIITQARPQSSSTTSPKGRILMRVDPAAIGRFTRLELHQQGYQVTSVHDLTPEAIARQHPDTVLFFHHTDEAFSPDAMQSLPQDVPVIVATVGNKQPDRQLIEFAKSRGYTVLSSKLGPNLHIVLRTLKQINFN